MQQKTGFKQTSNEVIHHLDEDTVCRMEEENLIKGSGR